MADKIELKGQAKVISEIRRRVDAWRGFELGSARDPFPDVAPGYDPIDSGDRPLTETSRTLLLHWFRREPHLVGPGQRLAFKYWPHQRRLVETLIYLYEVRGIRRTEALYALCGVEPLEAQHDPWAKLGGQLATGSGKTKMMSLLIARVYLNAVRERENSIGFGRHALVIAPGLFVRDRLLADFSPPDGSPSIFWADPVIPPELESFWDLTVYSSTSCPVHLDPAAGALVVTNYHPLLRTRPPAPELQKGQPLARQMTMLFEDRDPERLEDVASPLLERFAASRGVLVINDEAHHVWDEPGHARFERKAKEKAEPGDDEAKTAMAWIRSLRRLNGHEEGRSRLALQIDLSATLFEEQGASKSRGKGKSATEFKPADLFRHTAVHYGLAEAIRDGIVKKPILERVEVKKKKTGEPEPLIRVGPNAWEKYRNLLVSGIERWKKVRDQLRDEGDPRKPILFILANDKTEAAELANYITYGDAVSEDLSHRAPVGFPDVETGDPLFVDTASDGSRRSTVVQIHIGQKEESNEADWEQIRQAVNA